MRAGNFQLPRPLKAECVCTMAQKLSANTGKEQPKVKRRDALCVRIRTQY